MASPNSTTEGARVNCLSLQQSENGSQELKSTTSDSGNMSRTEALAEPETQTNTSMKPVTSAKEKEAAASSDKGPAGQQKTKEESSLQQSKRLSPLKRFALDCFLYLIKGLVSTYDLISWPVFYFHQSVSERRREVEEIKSVKIEPNNPDSTWRQVDITPRQIEIEQEINSFKTYDEMMRSSMKRNGPYPCYGYRQVLEERWSKRADGSDKLIRQVRLTDFKWCTYEQFDQQIEAIRRAFLRDGVRAGQKVIVFADTRAEWQIVSHALLRLGAVLCTMYSTLGVDGIIHTCNETKASMVITQRDKVERLLKLANKLPTLKKVVYFDSSLHLPIQLGGDRSDDDYIKKQQDEKFQFQEESNIECVRFAKLFESGLRPEAGDVQLEEENRYLLDKRTKDSLAVIMYTSGSTGIPKGVLISHGNIMATVKSFSYVTKDFVHAPRDNVCTAYLPLAHIFEFCIESVMLYHGVRYGFATPHTLTDRSPGLIPGSKGDLGLLRPTVMIIVPLILDRIVQGIKQVIKMESYLKQQLVSYLIDYKSYWQRRQYDTPLVDKIICSKISQALGGRAKWVICGSAPLSAQTQTYVRAALNLRLPQGYGTTETCAATACQSFYDQSTQNVGLPVAGAKIKLEPWYEGNYRPDDKPNPRGEIVVGGEMIAHGYFNLEEQTNEAFYVDDQGTRWYRTGDIGEFLPNGQLKIIDRKKDLVKLQNGEYISLGRVESTLKSNPYTENFCVYLNSNYNYVVALGPANEAGLKQLAQQIVDHHDKSLKMSPATAKRQGLPDSQDERQNLLLGGQIDEAAMLELREISSTYQTDCLNNNETSTKSKSNQSESDDRLTKLCSNKLIIEHVLKYITDMARERNLLTLEIPKKLLLIPEEWTEDKNLVTAAMKIRRNFIYKRYQLELDQIYASSKA